MKEAQLGLPGVLLVRDEWDRDLLTVTFDPQQITVEKLQATIAQEGFEAEVVK